MLLPRRLREPAARAGLATRWTRWLASCGSGRPVCRSDSAEKSSADGSRSRVNRPGY